jgi:hypothetical protein
MRHTRRSTVAALAVLGVLAVVAVGYAAIPGQGGVIYGCYSSGPNAPGQLRVIDNDAGAKCAKNEKQLTFNQQGPKGDACLPSTPACVGPTGSPGTDGVDGTDGKDGQSCTATNADGSLVQPACRGPQGIAGDLGVEKRETQSDENSDGQKVKTAYCPAGKIAISGGAEVIGPTGGLDGDSVAINDIDVFNLASAGSGATVGALEVGGGTTNSWSLIARVVCVAAAG